MSLAHSQKIKQVINENFTYKPKIFLKYLGL